MRAARSTRVVIHVVQATLHTIMANSGIDGEYSVYVGNLDPATSLSDMEDLLYELFLQVTHFSHLVNNRAV